MNGRSCTPRNATNCTFMIFCEYHASEYLLKYPLFHTSNPPVGNQPRVHFQIGCQLCDSPPVGTHPAAILCSPSRPVNNSPVCGNPVRTFLRSRDANDSIHCGKLTLCCRFEDLRSIWLLLFRMRTLRAARFLCPLCSALWRALGPG